MLLFTFSRLKSYIETEKIRKGKLSKVDYYFLRKTRIKAIANIIMLMPSSAAIVIVLIWTVKLFIEFVRTLFCSARLFIPVLIWLMTDVISVNSGKVVDARLSLINRVASSVGRSILSPFTKRARRKDIQFHS